MWHFLLLCRYALRIMISAFLSALKTGAPVLSAEKKKYGHKSNYATNVLYLI